MKTFPEALVSLMSAFQLHINIFFSFLQFNLHKKQAVLFCLQKYVRVGVYTRAREMSIVRGEERGIEEEARILLVPSFKLHLGFSLLENSAY